MTDAADDDPAMPDALEMAAAQDAEFARTGRRSSVRLHGVVLALADQYDTFDMRSTSGGCFFTPTIARPMTPLLSRACARRARLSWPKRTRRVCERRLAQPVRRNVLQPRVRHRAQPQQLECGIRSSVAANP